MTTYTFNERGPMFYSWLDAGRTEPCPFCSSPWHEILELDGHDGDSGHRSLQFWLTGACCEDMLTELEFTAEHDGWRYLISTMVGWLVGQEFGTRQIYWELESDDVDCDFGLTVEKWTPQCELKQKAIKEFISRNHRHNAAPVQWKWAHLIWNGPDLIAVAWTGRPVARMIDHSTTVEVNRLCIDHSLNSALTWKAASTGYKAAAREAEFRGFEKIITYTIEGEESGMSLRYARWKKDGSPSQGGSWNRAGRPREDTASIAPKQRWVKLLRPSSRRAA